jgi:hypothetical protein
VRARKTEMVSAISGVLHPIIGRGEGRIGGTVNVLIPLGNGRLRPYLLQFIMEPTITQNSALFFAHHKDSKQRNALFRKFRAAANNQAPDVRGQLTLGDWITGSHLHPDNGR